VNLHGRIVPLFDLAPLDQPQPRPRYNGWGVVRAPGVAAAAMFMVGRPPRWVFPP
jgi:hypothetical protein